ncbi:unnamed protein product [Wuchereria bancrofti]|uniref:Uncharacterized protein n=2 Tax=Wuchereria bancrofti TaxID=6293 RepID=A0A3P7E0Q6_WUCBA|nr:unnamed protein product [Wuchereria bancrofti]
MSDSSSSFSSFLDIPDEIVGIGPPSPEDAYEDSSVLATLSLSDPSASLFHSTPFSSFSFELRTNNLINNEINEEQMDCTATALKMNIEKKDARGNDNKKSEEKDKKSGEKVKGEEKAKAGENAKVGEKTKGDEKAKGDGKAKGEKKAKVGEKVKGGKKAKGGEKTKDGEKVKGSGTDKVESDPEKCVAHSPIKRKNCDQNSSDNAKHRRVSTDKSN